MPDPIPVTLLTGFLGAGKTTLLNHLLHDPGSGRIAVVVNEFGEAGLDHDLIESSAEDVVLMPAGCICCTIRGDLSKTLTGLLGRRMRGELAFDRLVIETTGLADPGPIHHTLLVDPVLAPNYALDGIVTVVDAVLGAGTLDQHLEAQAQVAMADRIVLSKTDLADPAALDAVTAALDQLNPGARRITAEKGAVPQGALFGLGALRQAMTPAHALDWLAAAPASDPLRGVSGLVPARAPRTTMPAPSHHASDARISTASITLTEPIAPEVFDFWLDMLIALRGAKILRMKGIVHIKGAPQAFVFHGVQHIFEPPVPLSQADSTDTTSRIVLIARDMAKAELDESLSMLLMTPERIAQVRGLTVHSLEEPF
ncbi:MAG: CobW family GTP-binding protein [Roseinatronobacter sp.]